MDNTIALQQKAPTLLIALLAALLLLAIAFIHTQHRTMHVTIPQAAELQWASDTSWTGGWR